MFEEEKPVNIAYWKKLLALLLTASGMVLVIQGARILVESYSAQHAAARDFHAAASPALSRSPAVSAYRRGETVARLTIPRLHTDLFVVEGDSARELLRGPGHLAGSAMPGGRGNCIIAGHRDTHFRVLKDIRAGDRILLRTDQGEFQYVVHRATVVSPSDTSALQPTRGTVLNLITCYPFNYVGSAPKRFVVEARPLNESPGGPQEKTKISKIRNAR